MKRFLMACTAVGVATLITCCGSSGSGEARVDWTSEASEATTTTSAPEVPPVTDPPATVPAPVEVPLSIKVIGTCETNMFLDGRGFTPNGDYRWSATYPDGREYIYRANGGVQQADGNGNTPDWQWKCFVTPDGQPDPAGTYQLTVQDLTTNDSVSTTFVVSYS